MKVLFSCCTMVIFFTLQCTLTNINFMNMAKKTNWVVGCSIVISVSSRIIINEVGCKCQTWPGTMFCGIEIGTEALRLIVHIFTVDCSSCLFHDSGTYQKSRIKLVVRYVCVIMVSGVQDKLPSIKLDTRNVRNDPIQYSMWLKLALNLILD